MRRDTSVIPVIPESVFQAQVVDLAHMLGWKTYHTHDSRRSDKGFLDLVMARDRVVYAELKTETGRPSPEQEEWMAALIEAGQEVYLWRPSDWDVIVEVLRRNTKARIARRGM